MVECFVIYLCAHNRPPHEILDSRDKEQSWVYQEQFAGMTNIQVSLEQLLATRSRLRSELRERFTRNQRLFLLSLVRAEPDWSLLSCAHASELPGIQWKLAHLRKFRDQQAAAFAEQSREMEALLRA